MPKRIFWPATLIVMGLIFLASNLQMLPAEFWNLWPLILIVVGLGGLVTSDREEWMSDAKPARSSKSTAVAKPAKKAAKKTKRK